MIKWCMTQNAENAIRNGIKYPQPCLSTLLPSPCSSDLMILVNILSDVAAFLQHIQTHSNVLYFPVLWDRLFTLPGNFLFSAFWEPLHYNLSPSPLLHPRGLPKLTGLHSIRGTLMSPRLPSCPWWWSRRQSRHPLVTVTLLASENRLPPPASWEMLSSVSEPTEGFSSDLPEGYHVLQNSFFVLVQMS